MTDGVDDLTTIVFTYPGDITLHGQEKEQAGAKLFQSQVLQRPEESQHTWHFIMKGCNASYILWDMFPHVTEVGSL